MNDLRRRRALRGDAAETHRFTVYEVVNERRREIYVGMDERPMFEIVRAFRREPPREVSHWRWTDSLNFRSLEFGLERAAARVFIDGYAASMSVDGWRLLRSKTPKASR